MNIKILEDKKNKLTFEIDVSHTLCNALKVELSSDTSVKNVGYNVRHPLISKPVFMIETDGSDPRKILSAAAQRVKKLCEKAEAGL